jgi:hypothetical protein
MAKKTTDELTQAFVADGYDVKDVQLYQNQRGIRAEHRTARNTRTSAPKKAFYVEGNGFQMGYLTGLLAEEDVSKMAGDYVEKVILAFIAPGLTGLSHSIVYHILLAIVKEYCQVTYALHRTDIPKQLQDEMNGIVAGCKASNANSSVTYENILALNAGQDCLVSLIYTGIRLPDWIEHILPKLGGEYAVLAEHPEGVARARGMLPELKPEFFRLPLACNAFCAFGDATNDGKVYFGRDFQFPTASVLQDHACLIVYNPAYPVGDGRPALPLVAMSAPGFVGAITAMNAAGVGIGVNMVPAGNCDPGRPGLNSLLLVRHAGQCGYGAAGAVAAIVAAQRGASWCYPIGDAGGRAAFVEGGRTIDHLDYLSYPPPDYKPLLPKGPFQPAQRGVMVRWNDWQYPMEYLQYNQALFQKMGCRWDQAQFEERGFIDPLWHGGPVDQTFFFAPQRESKSDLLIAANQFIIPEMRLCAMRTWTNLVAKSKMSDLLWRYDELNKECLEAYGTIDEAAALKLINFLSPKGKFPAYYGNDPIIQGSVSLCNLTNRIIHSHFGYHDDEWVKLTLPRYV